MKHWSRRAVLKSGLAIPATTALGVPSAPPAAGSVPPPAASGAAGLRERSLLDFGWRFHFGNANDPAKDFGFGKAGAMAAFQKTGNFLSPSNLSFDDRDWKPLDLPHDWAIELPFQNDPDLSSKGSYPLGRKYPETSVGWYRRVFELDKSAADRRISIEFDGVYREAMVVFNGFYLGVHRGGYDPFRFDLTDFAKPGDRNVLLVRVDASLSDGWFYEGAGIYRHVWLVSTTPVHVKQWGTFVRAEVNPGEAVLSIRTEVENHSERTHHVRVTSTVLDPSGKPVATAGTTPFSIPDWTERVFEQRVTVRKPALWSLEQRNLYKLVTEVESGGVVADRYETRFGIRSLRFDPEAGFFLNGKPVKVKGTCNHQDHAGLGAALPDAVQYYRVRALLEMGGNAYRTAHNPPTPELLDACDELGMLVLDETRMMSSNPEGLMQFANMVRRDRNHPSVFMYSMSNEEGEARTEFGVRILTAMKRLAAELDGSRLVTSAPVPFGPLDQGGLAVSDVAGYNYADPEAERFHKTHPKVPVIGTEVVSAVGTRGIYVTDKEKGYVGSYDPYTTTGRASAEGWWRFANARPWICGGFVWTGFDYRGETSPYEWPNISSQYGILDTCGFPKDTYFYYQAWWTSEPVLHLFPHWNWPGLEGKEIAVWVYSNLDKVELFHNGQSLGAKNMPKDSHLAWNVKYAPGSIEARGYKDERQVMIAKRETSGAPAALGLRADRFDIAAGGEDVAMVRIEVVDSHARVVPVANNEISFRVTGAGKLLGVGNGDPTSHESDIAPRRKAFSGMCMALIQASDSPGTIGVEASSPGLALVSVGINVQPAVRRPRVAVWERPVPTGSGITGLWRPEPAAAAQANLIEALLGGSGDMVFTFRTEGSSVTGSVESPAGVFGGGGTAAIEEGRIEGNQISFRAGGRSYNGTFDQERIELRKGPPQFPGLDLLARHAAPTGPRPAVGPPPDGTDPSFPPIDPAKLAGPPLVLRRAAR